MFFGYLGAVALIVVAIAVSLALTPPRDPNAMYVAMLANIKTMDPAVLEDYDTDRMVGNIFECLYNYQFAKQPYTLIPQLAEGMPRYSKDGLTVTIHLKHGIHFYDPNKKVWPTGTGPEITADTIIYSWKRVCDFYLGETGNYAEVFQGKIVGIDDWFNYTQSCPSAAAIDWDRPVAGLKALDRYTLQIKLTSPWPQVKYLLAYLPTCAVSRDAVNYYGEEIRSHPIGSGPYAMEEYLPEQKFTLVANPIYRGGPNVESGTKLPADQRMPHIQQVDYLYYPEDLPRWYIFREGLLDINDVPKDKFAEAIRLGTGELTPQMHSDGVRLVKSPLPWSFYTCFNMSDPIVGRNKALRQAMSMAYDRQKFIKIYLNGRGIASNGPIPPGFPTYDANRINPYCVFNLPAAREKMKEAIRFNGGKPIPTLTLYEGDTTTTAVQMAQFFVSCMAQIGLNVNVQYATWARFQQIVNGNEAQIFDFGWTADYPDEQDFWQLFYGKNTGYGGINSEDFKNAEFDALYEKSSVLNEGPERAKLYAQMQAIVLDECPCIFDYYPISYTLYYKWVGNVFGMNYGEGFLQDRTLDLAMRTEWLKQHG